MTRGETHGGKALRKAVKQHGGLRTLARVLGIESGTLSRHANCVTKPHLDYLLLYQSKLGIEPKLFRRAVRGLHCS